MADANQTILGIDIGSSFIKVMIAESKDGVPHVIGTAQHKSQGLKKGAIVNIELASRVIRAAINDAKRVAGVNCNNAIVSIPNVYAKSCNSSGVINSNSHEIGIKEIRRATQTALYNASIPPDHGIIHMLPYKFQVDDQYLIDDPMGMMGSRLEVYVHIIHAPKSALNNLRKAVKTAGVDVKNIVLSGYASAIAVLEDHEKEQGVACIDMGGSTCDLVIHVGNSIQYNAFLGVGSNHVTTDLFEALRTPISAAEDIKIKLAPLSKDQIQDGIMEMPVSGDEQTTMQVQASVIYNIIYVRIEETLLFLAKYLESSKLKDQVVSGVVLTGGMVKLKATQELANAVFANMPVRIAHPRYVSGFFDSDDPSFSTVVGLILYGTGFFTNYEFDSEGRTLVRMGKFNDEDVTIPNIAQDMTDFSQTIPEKEVGSDDMAVRPRTKVVAQKSSESALRRFWQWLTGLF